MPENPHIGIVSRYFPPQIGGVQTHIEKVSRILMDRGYEISGCTTVTETSDLDNDIPITRLGYNGFLQDTKRMGAVARRLSDECDVVHIHSAGQRLSTITELVARIESTPVLLTLHGGGVVDRPEYSQIRRFRHRATRRFTIQLADRVISTCPRFTDIATRFVSADRIREIPGGVDTDFYVPADPDMSRVPAIEDLQPANIILSVNMIKPVKGMQYVVQALPSVLDRHPDTHYVVVGNGEFRSTLASMAEDHGVSDHVHFVGPTRDQATVRAYLRASNIAVVPSSGESTSISALEALATGTPLVASPVGGLADLIGDNERGRIAELFPPKSYNRDAPLELPEAAIESLADQFSWVLSNPEEVDRMVSAGRDHVVSEYDWSVIVDGLTEVYDEVL
jgi:glycosyltransferase involved in cell wall biosynthesis